LLIEDYFHNITEIIDKSPVVQSKAITYDKRSSYIGFIRGSIWLPDNSVLHIREYVNVQNDIELYMYAYQYQDANDLLIFRYDNTPHFPNLSTFPHHKHNGNETDVIPSICPN